MKCEEVVQQICSAANMCKALGEWWLMSWRQPTMQNVAASDGNDKVKRILHQKKPSLKYHILDSNG